MKNFSLVLALAVAIFAMLPDLAFADSCSLLGSVRSTNSNTPARLTFINKTSGGRSIIWIGFSGETHQYKWLEPGGKWTVNTFLTHPWLVTDGPGNCYGIYVASGRSDRIVLTRDGEGGGD
jgi:hypothetical protein